MNTVNSAFQFAYDACDLVAGKIDHYSSSTFRGVSSTLSTGANLKNSKIGSAVSTFLAFSTYATVFGLGAKHAWKGCTSIKNWLAIEKCKDKPPRKGEEPSPLVPISQIFEQVTKGIETPKKEDPTNNLLKDPAKVVAEEKAKLQLLENQKKTLQETVPPPDNLQEQLDALTPKIAEQRKAVEMAENILSINVAIDTTKANTEKTLTSVKDADYDLNFLRIPKKPTPLKEARFWIPLTNQDLVVKHGNIKESLTQVAVGTVSMQIGVLGTLGSIGAFDNSVNPLAAIALPLGALPRYIAKIGAGITEAVSYFDVTSHIVGNGIASAGLFYGSYKTFTAIKWNWIELPNGRGWPTFNKLNFGKDVIRLAASTALAGTGALVIGHLFKQE